MTAATQTIKQIFLNQVGNYIDQYIQKNLK